MAAAWVSVEMILSHQLSNMGSSTCSSSAKAWVMVFPRSSEQRRTSRPASRSTRAASVRRSETPLLPGLDGRKMSKSYGNAINISMTAEETAKRIKKSQTDSERMITFDPENRPGVSGLLSTAAICTGRSEVEIAEEIGMGGSGQLKKYVPEAVNEYFAPIRERRQRYENDLDYVKDVQHEGNRRANEIAEQTLAEVQDAMGMVY